MKERKSRKVTTLADIGRSLGITANAVSKALKDAPDISRATKELVRKTAEDMGYLPNQAAVTLKSGQGKNVAIVENNLLNPFYSVISDRIVSALNEKGFYGSIVFCPSEQMHYQDIVSRMPASYCAVISLVEPDDEVIQVYKKRGIPFALIGIRRESKDIDLYYTDDNHGGELIARRCLELGRRRPLFVTDSVSETSNRRFQGFRRTLQAQGVDPLYVPSSGNVDVTLEKAAKEIVEKEVDFVFAYSDYLAILLRRKLRRRKYVCPIYGFDRLSERYDLLEPTNSVGCDFDSLTSIVTDDIIQKVETEKKEHVEKVFPVSLYEHP